MASGATPETAIGDDEGTCKTAASWRHLLLGGLHLGLVTGRMARPVKAAPLHISTAVTISSKLAIGLVSTQTEGGPSTGQRTKPQHGTNHMTVEEKRQVLYAAILRYSPEAGSLRERALDRLVLVALVESSSLAPLKIGQVQQLTRVAPGSPGLRMEIIQQALQRLMSRQKVAQTLLKKKNVYYLTDAGRDDTDKAAESARQLFQPVLARMLQNTSVFCEKGQGEIACRRFVSECFARFGQQIAKAVTGEFNGDQLLATVDVEAAFAAATASMTLSIDATQSLKARCIRFLRSNERDDQELKFRLTQGYYVAQLLDINTHDFNPIADDAFSGAILYIDTNVLIGRLLSDDRARLFNELVRIAQMLGIRLRVSRATVDEARWVAAGRLSGLDKVIECVPSEFVARTQDAFLDAFIEVKKLDPSVSAEDFRARFDTIPDLLTECGIELHDVTSEDIVGRRDISRECEVLRQAAIYTRGRGKRDQACVHDVCHFLLVKNERQNNNRAWFLTLDKTLGRAASQLCGDKLPFCFPLVGFLQSVSPFVEAPEAQQSLVDLFSDILEGEVGGLSRESLFDLSELKLISELHTDVLATPVDQIIPAFDYVKGKVLGGRPYRRDDQTKVALELKKFLTSSMEEKQRALHEAAQLQKGLAEAERAKRVRAEADVEARDGEVARLRTEMEAEKRERLSRERRAAENEREKLEQLNAEVQRAGRRSERSARAVRRLCGAVAVLGSAVASAIWAMDVAIAESIVELLQWDGSRAGAVAVGARVAGGLLLVGSFLPSVSMLRASYRLSALATVAALAIGGMDILGSEMIGRMAGYLAIGVPVALALTIMLGWSRLVDMNEN